MEFRCKKCVITRSRYGIQFNEEGICYPCLHAKKQKKIDWSSRWLELDKLCQKHRNHTGEYDCVICVSGGKDSWYLVHTYVELLGMHPLCVMVDNASWTETGRKNFYALSERYGVDMITFTPNVKRMKEKVKKDFLKHCHPMRYWDRILYRKPLEIAKKFGIKLVIWGENTHISLGGSKHEETPNAKIWLEDPNEFPDLDVIFTSYYIPWDRYENVRVAKLNGFKGLLDTKEWVNRDGFIPIFQDDQIDSIFYLCNQYLNKFIKCGYSNMTELCSIAIRLKKMTREDAMEIVREHDWKLDIAMERGFCKYIGISIREFWRVVDKFANKDILKKYKNIWKLKEEFLE